MFGDDGLEGAPSGRVDAFMARLVPHADKMQLAHHHINSFIANQKSELDIEDAARSIM